MEVDLGREDDNEREYGKRNEENQAVSRIGDEEKGEKYKYGTEGKKGASKMEGNWSYLRKLPCHV